MSITLKLISILLIAGMLFTVWDWQRWRQAELSKFGQGQANQITVVATPLGKPVSWPKLDFRLSPPQGWTVDMASSAAQLAKFAHDEVQIRVESTSFSDDLAVEADSQVSKLPPLSRDRQYITGNAGAITILTWVEGEQTHQRAMVGRQDQLVIMEATAPTAVWSTYEPTFWVVYQSLTWF